MTGKNQREVPGNVRVTRIGKVTQETKLAPISKDVNPINYFNSQSFLYTAIDSTRGIYQRGHANYSGDGSNGAIRFQISPECAIDSEKVVVTLTTADKIDLRRRVTNLEKIRQEVATWFSQQYDLEGREIILNCVNDLNQTHLICKRLI